MEEAGAPFRNASATASDQEVTAAGGDLARGEGARDSPALTVVSLTTVCLVSVCGVALNGAVVAGVYGNAKLGTTVNRWNRCTRQVYMAGVHGRCTWQVYMAIADQHTAHCKF